MSDSTTESLGNPLGYAPIDGLIRKFSVPAIISMLVNSAYNITDQIFIGHAVGMLGNAATSVAFPVVTLCIALSQLVGIGTASNFNLCMGAGKQENAKKFIGTGLCATVILGLLLGLLVILFKTPILIVCGSTENVLPLAVTYLGITGFGLPFQLFTSSGSMLIRADSSPSYSMICTVTGAVLNVGLDALFMLQFGWGIRGAALATAISQMVSFALCFCYFFRFKTFRIEACMLRIRAAELRRIAKLGLSNFLNLSVMMLVNIVLNNTLSHYGALSVYGGDIPLAVSGVVAKLNNLVTAFTVGLAQGCQPIFSFNKGAGNYNRLKETYKKAIVVAFGLGVVAFLVFQFFPRQITSIFGTGTELYYRFAEQYLRIYLMMVCIGGVQPLTVNYFTSIGDVRRGIMLALSRQGLFLLPMLLILPLIFGLNGALYAGPIAEVAAFALAMTMMVRHIKKLDSLIQV